MSALHSLHGPTVREKLECHQAACTECRRNWFNPLCPEGRRLADDWWLAREEGEPGAQIDDGPLREIWRGVPPVTEEYPRTPVDFLKT